MLYINNFSCKDSQSIKCNEKKMTSKVPHQLEFLFYKKISWFEYHYKAKYKINDITNK